jgi:CRP-like cAMP-binding protein
MTTPDILEALRLHPFLQGMSEAHIAVLASGAMRINIAAGKYLGQEREPAEAFFLIESGRVAIEINTPKRGLMRIQTIERGEIVGWSWLVPPHRWQFDARAIEPVQALELDGKHLRERCEQDHHLGSQVMRRLVTVIAARLSATRLQLLDVYR